MKLTNKCKEDFEEWLKDNYHEYDFYNIMEWWEHIFSMQYGLYVEFFDSVGKFDVEFYASSLRLQSDKARTRHERWLDAIEKANEIYNTTK